MIPAPHHLNVGETRRQNGHVALAVGVASPGHDRTVAETCEAVAPARRHLHVGETRWQSGHVALAMVVPSPGHD